MAREEVTRCLAGTVMPRAFREFLTTQWQALLARIHARYGTDSPAWKEATRTMDDLAWSLTVKSSQEDCIRLMEGMPGLLKRLHMGLEALGSTQEAKDHFFMDLAAYHAEVVNLSLSYAPAPQVEPATSPEIPAPRLAEPSPAQAEPARYQAVEPFVPAPPVPAPPARQASDEVLAGLSVGSWLEFQEPDGAPRELKLAWVSPRKSQYLLTNRQGERALSLSAVDFSRALREGRARVIHSPVESSGNEGSAPERPHQEEHIMRMPRHARQ